MQKSGLSATFAILAIVAALTSACGSDPKTADRSANGSTPGASPATLPNPCELATKAEIQEIFGFVPEAQDPTPRVPDNDPHGRTCSWWPERSRAASAQVSVHGPQFGGCAHKKGMTPEEKALYQATIEPVSELGEAAVWMPRTTGFETICTVHKGIEVWVLAETTPPASKSAVLTFMTSVLARM